MVSFDHVSHEWLLKFVGHRVADNRVLRLIQKWVKAGVSEDGEWPETTVPKRLRLVLGRSNRWGRIRCEISYAMTSKYPIALYELICLRANREHCVEVMSCEEFRDLLGVPPGTYERGLDFKRKVIDPALLEVNGLSDMGVDIELRRRHARASIHEVAISWWRKSGDEYRAAMQERNRSKVGRMARLRGEVETIVSTSMQIPGSGGDADDALAS